MNLDFENENYRFNARVSAIIYNEDKTKVLLFKINNKDFYMLPGGRIEFNEDSENAIKREIREELNCELDYTLCSIQENFICRDGISIMQYCFCYKSVYNGKINKDEFKCLDNDNQTFYWVDIKNIDSLKIFPLCCSKLILDNSDTVFHIIEK